MENLNDNFSFDELRNFIFNWNIDFPIDRLWRKKHGVTFNSSIHREISFIDMFIELMEDSLYEEVVSKKEKLEDDPYVSGQRNFLFKREISQDFTDEEFERINLDELD